MGKKVDMIVRQQYKAAKAVYRPIALWEKPITDEQMPRLHSILDYMLNSEPVIDESTRIIKKYGVDYYNKAPRAPEMTRDFVQGIGKAERKALIYTAALVVAEQEVARGKPFNDEQLVQVAMSAINTLYRAKKNIQSIEHLGYSR